MASSTLETIQVKVRRLTLSPSEDQLSTTDLNNYINTFVLYDFPSHLRLFALKQNFVFYTEPFIDNYSTVTAPTSSPLYNFRNLYITTDKPLYIAGYQSYFTQSQADFYNIYPKINNISSIGVSGDGITTTFIGVINSQQNTPLSAQGNQQINLLQNNVIFDSIDASGNSILLVDYPVSTYLGALGIPNTPQTIPSPYGQINYVTGAYTVNFPVAPAVGAQINSQAIFYTPTRPQSMLYFNDTFFFRPVPDQAYKIEMEVFVRPTELLAGQSPYLEQWWQYIAYGAALKIFQDRMDLDSANLIMPEFKVQETLVNRTTWVQITKERTETIYTAQNQWGYNGWGWGQGGGLF